MTDQPSPTASDSSVAEPPTVAERSPTSTPREHASAARAFDSSAEKRFGLPEQPPLSWREPLALVLLVVAFDLTIYRTHGFSGPAAWLLVAPLLLALGVPRFRPRGSVVVIGLMLLVMAGRTFWQGSLAGVSVGFGLLIGLAVALAGRTPYVSSLVIYLLQTAAAGPQGAIHYLQSMLHGERPQGSRSNMLNLLLPLIAVGLFGAIFIRANPDLVEGLAHFVRQYVEWLSASLANFVPEAAEVWLWILLALVVIGLYRPVITDSLLEVPAGKSKSPAEPASEASMYAACRNTLVALIVLFAVYLVFEFRTLWFREFPEGFYYAGYAHEGAAWLTVALALATLVLSLIFRGALLRDRRLGRLRILAWIWSALNLVLAAAVYNRMYIYIDFNGMTRMRTVGLLGISCVVVGFLLVVCMIVRQRSFFWLVQRQLWSLAFFVFLYLVLPVDLLVQRYNVQRVLAGDLAPVVQITEHAVSSEGVLMLPPLLESADPLIREGIRALLAERFLELNQQAAIRHEQDWTAYQHADQLLLDELDRLRHRWEIYADAPLREQTLQEFQEYAYQWY